MRLRWAQAFYQSLSGFKFVPGGRTLASAGAAPDAILVDCFFNRRLQPTPALFCESSWGRLDDATGRPYRSGFLSDPSKGLAVLDGGAQSPGALAIMDIWRAIAANIVGTDVSFMAALWCSHPDIEGFICDARAGLPGRFNRVA